MQENRSFDHYFGTLSGVRGEWLTGNLPAAAGGISDAVPGDRPETLAGTLARLRPGQPRRGRTRVKVSNSV
jgi:hypothetical protein